MTAKSALLLVGVVIGVGVSVALAKGPPQKVIISGGDLAQAIEITGDEDTLNALGFMALEDYTTLTAETPEGLSGDGYLIERFFRDDRRSGEYVPFDQERYYPDPEGGRGYLFYVGIVNGSSEYDNKWFRAVPENEAVLQSVITSTPRETLNVLDLFRRALAVFVAAQ